MQAANRSKQQSSSQQVLAWLVIFFGVLRQFLIVITGNNCMPVLLNPPGEICPFASVNAVWWFVLALGTAFLYILTAAGRLEAIPTRVVNPFYLYLIFLLIFVKPV